MLTIFYTQHFHKTILVLLFFSFPYSILSSTLHEKTKEKLFALQEKVTKRFETKLNQTKTTLETCIAALKIDPLYGEMETALHALYQDPTYKLYKTTLETHEFILELEGYNKTIIHPELLTKINNLLEQLKNYEHFTSLRSTLKKQRVALLELFEEKELILSVEKILQYQDKELEKLLTKQREKINALPSYQHAQEVQKKYLETKATKNFLFYLEKKRDLIVQEQSALLKNKEYQKALSEYELLYFDHKYDQNKSNPQTKDELLRLRYEFFTVPLENTL